ncbi:transposase [Pedobacter agri]|uniref:transposase n=1 Tax=Pedobacter agri TaxID=454586 RepID=UPI00292DB865|nr:transposase [Pedobacter agri]
MNNKFQNKYRIPSARLQSWDYTNAGAYFITICTEDRHHYFGKVINGKMVLTNAGVIADILWHEIKHHNKNIELGEFIVMPNHIHGILILNDNGMKNIETGHALSLAPKRPNRPHPIPSTKTQNHLDKNDFKTRAKIPSHLSLAAINLP